MAEYSRIAKGNFTATGTTQYVRLPFIPDFVEIWNYTNIKTAAATKVTRAWWDASLIDGTTNPTMVEGYGAAVGGTVFNATFASIATGGISPLSQGLALQFGASQQVVASTKGTTTSFQVTAHGYNVGDTVMFEGLFQSATTGMPQMNGVYFTIITRTDADNFIVNWNSNNASYTNLSASPAGAKVKKVLNPFIYVPQESVITAITLGATTTVTTAEYHNFEVGQEIAFRIPNQWGTIELNSLPNVTIPGSPIYGYVVSVTDNWTFVCNINSSAFTAFTSNVAVSAVSGLTFPQVVAVGDVNTGGNIIFAGSALYPSPRFPTSTNRVSTINGPAIRGAFVNNTSQGFFIGAGLAGSPISSGPTNGSIMTTSDQIVWRAILHDYTTTNV
jgi:hypothetical protein